MTFGPLVSTDWLAEHLGDPDLKIIDGSWRMPGEPPAIENYKARHIPGAVFFDIDAVADASTDLPHMLPEPEEFEAAVGALSVSEKDRIVVYDEKGLFSAARVWWTFRVMGHENIAVLDGGLPKWLKEGKPVTTDETVLTRTEYKTDPKPQFFADAEDVRTALKEGATVLDARSEERFSGKAGEPRAGLRSGHMPGATCLPFGLVIGEDGRLRPREELELLFANAGAAPGGARVITSCGSGVTAAILFFALETIGAGNAAVYDGSWSEWGDEENDDALFPIIVDA